MLEEFSFIQETYYTRNMQKEMTKHTDRIIVVLVLCIYSKCPLMRMYTTGVMLSRRKLTNGQYLCTFERERKIAGSYTLENSLKVLYRLLYKKLDKLTYGRTDGKTVISILRPLGGAKRKCFCFRLIQLMPSLNSGRHYTC